MNINDFNIPYIWYDVEITEAEKWNGVEEFNPFMGMYERKHCEVEAYFTFDDIEEIHVYPNDCPDIVLIGGIIVESEQFVEDFDYIDSPLHVASRLFFNKRIPKIDDYVILTGQEELLVFFKTIIASMVME